MKKNVFKGMICVGAAMFMLTTTTSAHTESTGIPAADHRIETMKELGKNMKAVAAFAKGNVEYSVSLKDNTNKINEIAQGLHALFPEGSGGDKTRSKPDIWSDKAGFILASEKFQIAAATLSKAVATMDQATVGQALGATGKTCGGCHKPFRKPKE